MEGNSWAKVSVPRSIYPPSRVLVLVRLSTKGGGALAGITLQIDDELLLFASYCRGQELFNDLLKLFLIVMRAARQRVEFGDFEYGNIGVRWVAQVVTGDRVCTMFDDRIWVQGNVGRSGHGGFGLEFRLGKNSGSGGNGGGFGDRACGTWTENLVGFFSGGNVVQGDVDECFVWKLSGGSVGESQVGVGSWVEYWYDK